MKCTNIIAEYSKTNGIFYRIEFLKHYNFITAQNNWHCVAITEYTISKCFRQSSRTEKKKKILFPEAIEPERFEQNH